VAIYGSDQAKDRHRAANTKREVSIAKCVSLDTFVLDAACAEKALDAIYDDATDAYDLKAQQEMAMWALLMLIVTSAGVYYVIMTLKAATEANDGFKVSAEKQLRAYLSVTATNIKISPNMSADFPQKVPVAFHVRVKNHGQTPAHAVRVWANITYNALPIPEDFIDRFTEELVFNDVINPGASKSYLFDKDVLFHDRGIWDTPAKSFILLGVVKYTTFGNEKFSRFTGHVLDLKNWWLKIRHGEHAALQFVTVEHGNEAD
jgi:hypothetical protein